MNGYVATTTWCNPAAQDHVLYVLLADLRAAWAQVTDPKDRTNLLGNVKAACIDPDCGGDHPAVYIGLGCVEVDLWKEFPDVWERDA